MSDASSEDIVERLLAIEEEIYPESIDTPRDVLIENVDRAIGDYSVTEDSNGNYVITHDPNGQTFVFDGEADEVSASNLSASSATLVQTTVGDYRIEQDGNNVLEIVHEPTGNSFRFDGEADSLPSTPVESLSTNGSEGTAPIVGTDGTLEMKSPPNPVAEKNSAKTFAESDVVVGGTGIDTISGSIVPAKRFNVNQLSFNDSNQVTDYATDFKIREDGTQAILTDAVTGDGGVYFRGADFSTAYDITSLSQDGTVYNASGDITYSNFSFGGGTTVTRDGTHAAIIDDDDTVTTYEMSTAWDVSTMSKLSRTGTLSDLSESGYDLIFNDDGTVLLVLDLYGNIYRYTLSTAYDPTTRAFDGSFSSERTADRITIGAGGERMFIAYNTIYEYYLPTPYDPTASGTELVRSVEPSQTGNINSVGWVDSGNRFYISESNVIYQYDTTRSSSATAYIEWTPIEEPPKDVYAWDTAVFTRTLDNETVDIYIEEYSSGSWTEIQGPISRGDSITADPANEIRFRVDFSVQTGSNEPSLDSVSRRYKL